ncbi:MAG: hypothetical protein JSW10_10155 [Pseudomonadota bacterium]|nr:MAG: hypothetical protein JSW10_10155 [Pseudomonadota bacterium]
MLVTGAHETGAADRAALGQQLAHFEQQLAMLTADTPPVERAALWLNIADAQVGLEQMEAAWNNARQALDAFVALEMWQEAVEACNLLYQCGQPASVAALGQGVWLAVTFPVQPELTMTMLAHIVDETPPQSDGAAVAAMVSHYVVDLRTEGEKHDSLSFLTTNLIARVAERHSNIKDQAALDAWMARLELTDPQVFLPRLSQVINVMVQDQWWFDRDVLRAKLPDQ